MHSARLLLARASRRPLKATDTSGAYAKRAIAIWRKKRATSAKECVIIRIGKYNTARGTGVLNSGLDSRFSAFCVTKSRFIV